MDGRQRMFPPESPERPIKVIGAGPAGLACAIVLARAQGGG